MNFWHKLTLFIAKSLKKPKNQVTLHNQPKNPNNTRKSSPSLQWDINTLTFFNSISSLALIYLLYDFFYFVFHYTLHLPALYGYIHKHHHRQHSPTRGYLDASNVHPLEFVCGEYLHLAAVQMAPRAHGLTVVAFFILSAVLNSLNHTRFFVRWFGRLYDSRSHDVHHRLPQYNFCIYSRVWDTVFGTFRDYDCVKDGTEWVYECKCFNFIFKFFYYFNDFCRLLVIFKNGLDYC